jgi:hypothetical protein
MRTRWLAVGLCGVVAIGGIIAARSDVTEANASTADPVLVELYSSEGCSSCPPADQVLADLAGARGLSAPVIALELHVDYWNQLGWADPFSSPQATARQNAYVEAWGERSIYTPEMIVDGASGFVGSNRGAAIRAIEEASKAPKAKVDLTRSEGNVRIAATHIPSLVPGDVPEIWLAITESGLATDVPRGENSGRKLAHGPIVRSLRRVGLVKAGEPETTPLSLAPGWKRDHLRAVAFVQGAKTRRILGATSISLTDP